MSRDQPHHEEGTNQGRLRDGSNCSREQAVIVSVSDHGFARPPLADEAFSGKREEGRKQKDLHKFASGACASGTKLCEIQIEAVTKR